MNAGARHGRGRGRRRGESGWLFGNVWGGIGRWDWRHFVVRRIHTRTARRGIAGRLRRAARGNLLGDDASANPIAFTHPCDIGTSARLGDGPIATRQVDDLQVSQILRGESVIVEDAELAADGRRPAAFKLDIDGRRIEIDADDPAKKRPRSWLTPICVRFAFVRLLFRCHAGKDRSLVARNFRCRPLSGNS